MAKKKATSRRVANRSSKTALEQVSTPRRRNTSLESVPRGRTEESGVEAARFEAEEKAEIFGVDVDVFDAIEELKSELDLDLESLANQSVPAFARSVGLQNEDDTQLGQEIILGLGFGYKESAGFVTPEKCVKVYVDRKVSKERLAKNAIIPPKIGNYRTDVQVIAQPRFQAGLPCGNGMTPGSSGMWGTIGCLCVRDNKALILTNNHVAALGDGRGNEIPLETKVFGGPNQDSIGILYDYLPLRSANEADCALVWTDLGDRVASRHRAYEMDPNPSFGNAVMKDGFRTGFTSGRYIGGISEVRVDNGRGGQIVQRDQMVFSKMSAPGDSGSLIVRQDNNQPVALLWGGDGVEFTYGTPIKRVMDLLLIERLIGGDE